MPGNKEKTADKAVFLHIYIVGNGLLDSIFEKVATAKEGLDPSLPQEVAIDLVTLPGNKEKTADKAVFLHIYIC